jgi:hypothetical protein
MSTIDVPLKNGGFGRTARTDGWWIEPLLVFLGFSAFIVYSTWAGLQNAYYLYTGNGADYLSPMYSPLLMTQAPAWWPVFLPFSAAMLILWAPGGFRLTCYYYRGAYYKAFWADPPSCAVGEPRKTYWGEKSFPLILQNVHRYFLYLALIFILILSYDAFRAMWFTGADGRRHAGDDRQSDSAGRVHAGVPLVAASGGWKAGYDVEISGAEKDLRLRVVLESPPHDVGVVQPVLGGLHRHLHPHVRHGDLAGLENSVTWRSIKPTNSTCWWWVQAEPDCGRRSRPRLREQKWGW